MVFWSGGESSFQMCHLRITNHNEDGFDVKIESFPKESVHLATLEAIQNKENTDFFFGDLICSFKYVEPQAVQWAQG